VKSDVNDLIPAVVKELKSAITGEVKIDPVTRVLYSTDASIHQIKPLGVVFPHYAEELIPIVNICSRYKIPIIARGSGSSLAGQAIGEGLIIDCSRYLNNLIQINHEEKTATVEPGLVLDDLNLAAKKYNLQFGPDPASSERATLGGCIGNNATGAHSILYGMTADHILSAEVVLADGSVTNFKPVSLQDARHIATGEKNSASSIIEKQIYSSVLRIRNEYQDDIRQSWPHTWRRVSGYNLNYLLPWSPAQPPRWDDGQLPYPPVMPDMINLAQLLAGSEGTLGVIQTATIRLVHLKKHSLVSVLSFPGIIEACDIVPSILDLSPSAVELIPQSLIHLARSVPAYANQLSFVRDDPAALLAVEFSGEDAQFLTDQATRLHQLCHWIEEPFIAETTAQQKQVWDVRNVGLGILMSRVGDYKPISFIEDMAVPVERLGEFVHALDVLLNQHGTQADYYGHASAGCLHIRPLLNLKTQAGRVELRTIAKEATELALRLGGAISSEHGDGITRGEWIEKAYSPRVLQAFRMIKQAADPQGIFNPGKIVDPPKMDSSLRYDDQYHPVGWLPVMTFASRRPDAVRLVEAIEQCNGVGVCRKSGGVMCPSFQATGDEMYSTRGRANLMRAMISNGFAHQGMAIQAVKDTLELCLACKGCKAECPSAVDMAKLKYEFYEYYYTLPDHHHPVRDYLFGYIAQIARIGHWFAPLANYFLSTPQLAGWRDRLLGLSRHRSLPKLSNIALHVIAKPYIEKSGEADCLFLSDAFNEYFYPQTGLEAIKVLRAAGCRVKILSTLGAGRTLISKGFLKQAKKHARHLVNEISALDPMGRLPIVGLEPSEIYTLRDEYLDLLPSDNRMESIAQRAYMIDEFLLRPGVDGSPRIDRLVTAGISDKNRTNVLLHGHCYQKAQPPARDAYPTGVLATEKLLEMFGYQVTTIKDGCCGMAGAFGYESEHYAISMQVGRLALLPAVKESSDAIIAAAGISCKSQIEDGSGKKACHPISLVAGLIERYKMGER
jgi:FAD/FMN-containing dehydrogenase/Fe-S oxidoreductase